MFPYNEQSFSFEIFCVYGRDKVRIGSKIFPVKMIFFLFWEKRVNKVMFSGPKMYWNLNFFGTRSSNTFRYYCCQPLSEVENCCWVGN